MQNILVFVAVPAASYAKPESAFLVRWTMELQPSRCMGTVMELVVLVSYGYVEVLN